MLCASAVAQAVVIGFDQDADGNDIPGGTVIAEQYASMGVHFSGGFFTGNRIAAYSSYGANGNLSLNYLCTRIGASQSLNHPCDGSPSAGTFFVVDFDFDVISASFEGYTRNDGVLDINEVAAALTHAWEEKYVRDAMRLVHLSARVKDAFKVDQLRRALPVAARLMREMDADADGVVTLNEFCSGFGELLTQASEAASQ